MKQIRVMGAALLAAVTLTGCSLEDVNIDTIKSYLPKELQGFTFNKNEDAEVEEEPEVDLSSFEKADTYFQSLEDAGTITEEDYLEWGNYCTEYEHPDRARQLLIKVHTLYPKEDYLGAISQIPVEVTDQTVIDLADNVLENAAGGLIEVSMETVSTEEWQAAFNEPLVGVRRHSVMEGYGGIFDVYSDEYSTNLIFVSDEGEYRNFYVDGAGAYYYVASYIDGQVTDGFILDTYNTDGSLNVSYAGTLSNGVVVGNFSVEAEGLMYSGKFDEEGHTTEEQVEDATAAGCVVYAYEKNNSKKYLSSEGKADEFVITPEFMGIEVEAW